MHLQAEYWKVEEHEPIKSYLWAEMSPPPTRLNRWYTGWSELYVGTRSRMQIADEWQFAGCHGENIARPWRRYQLAESNVKDCDRQPNQYV